MTKREMIDQINAITGGSVVVHFEQRYNGMAYTAWVDDYIARVSRGFDASSEDAALSGLLNTLTELYPEHGAALAVAAE